MTPGTKLGPLPVWAWGLLVLGGVGLGLYLRRRSGSNATSVGTPIGSSVDPLSALGGATTGTSSDGSAATGYGIDPTFAGMLADSNSALVNESSILAGLTGQSVDSALGVASTALGQAADLFSTVRTAPVYVIASSPASSSPQGVDTITPTTTLTTTPTSPAPAASVAPSAPHAPTIDAAAVGQQDIKLAPSVVQGSSNILAHGAQVT